ncbi:MAG: CHAD domain-containing protein [Vicinamibacterales bacterium]
MASQSLNGRVRALHMRLDRELARARAGDVTGVHQARVATRRLREAVGALGTLLPSRVRRRARRALRRLTRALGPVRELDVTCARLDLEAHAHGWPPRTVRRVATDLRRARRVALTRCRRVLDEDAWGGVAPDVRRAVRTIEREDSPAALCGAAAERRRARARALLSGLGNLGALYVPDHLHAVRIAVKQLRYALEWEGMLGRRTWIRERRQLEHAQDVLGDWHDLLMVQAHVDRIRRSADPAHPVTGAGDMLAAIERQCRQRHAGILAEVPRHTRLAERARR